VQSPVSGSLKRWGYFYDFYGWIKLLEFKAGKNYVVTQPGKDLVLRTDPALDGKAIFNLQPGDHVQLIDGPLNADYSTWWKVKVGMVVGWVQVHTYWFDPL
jgi:hypothetical protein